MALLNFTDGSWHLDGNVRPVAFFAYESHVVGRLLEIPFKVGDSIDAMRTQLADLCNRYRLPKGAHVDNKTAYLVEHNGAIYALGFYDLTFSFGLSVRKTF